MPEPSRPSTGGEEHDLPPEALGHPRGTLAIVILYGLLFGLGWLAMLFFRFLPHGAPHH